MNNLIINKSNFWKILDKFYYIINNDEKSIIINYNLVDNKIKTNLNNFLKKIQTNPIKSKLDPITFQNNARNEWK
jgi:hypothetical protein